MKTYVEVGIDTGPFQYPRSMNYNKEGMLLEGWTPSGGPQFGISYFRMEVKDRDEGLKAKAVVKLAAEKLYEDNVIRGASLGIVYICTECNTRMEKLGETDVRYCPNCGHDNRQEL